MNKEQIKMPLQLKELRLPSVNQHWQQVLEEAQASGWTFEKFLTCLLEIEIADRQTRKLKKHLQEACLPKGKAIETYDFSCSSKIDKNQIKELCRNPAWVKEGMNLLIFGPSGVGKTHLASAIGEKLIQSGYRIIFYRTTELVQKLMEAKRDLCLPAFLDKLDKYDLLILDDFGYVKKDEFETSVLFELICERYERKSLLITCNQPFKEWDQIFTDKTMAIAAVDRIVHHAIIFEINEESYRKKTALKRRS
jgi:DNA replication protein DnaC